MSQKKTGNRRSFRSVLIILLVVLAATLCAALALLWTMTTQEPQVLTVEAGSSLPAASAFFPDSKQEISYISGADAVDTAKPGRYPVTLSKGFLKYNAFVQVEDTVAPTAQVSDLTVFAPNTVTAQDFVTDIQDVTAVTVRFEAEPDFSAAGTQTVNLLLEDQSGNKTPLQAQLTVIFDTTAPVITGVKDITTYVGDTVAYRSGVSVTDDYDESVKLELDNTGVDLSTPGTYTVTYLATDNSGNTTQLQAQVKVLEKRANHVEVDVIYEAVDAILAKILKEGMTDREKAEAIYVWTDIHFTYGGHTDTTDYIQSAYQFLKSKKGDCFGFFSLQKLMLQRLNIPTIDVQKVKNYPGDSNHYWLMVSVDGGENYYHYDNLWSKYLCLVTDKRLNSFSKMVKNCYNRDESLYPPTPEEPLPESVMPWKDPAILNTRP